MEQQRMTFSARYILRVIPFEVSRLHKKNEDFLSKLFEMCSRCVFEMCFRRNRKSFFLEKVFFWFSEHFIVSLLLFLETYTSLLLWTSEVALQFRIHFGRDFSMQHQKCTRKTVSSCQRCLYQKKSKKKWNSRGWLSVRGTSSEWFLLKCQGCTRRMKTFCQSCLRCARDVFSRCVLDETEKVFF